MIKFRMWIGLIVLFFCVLVAISLWPLQNFPAPTGLYGVGTVAYHLTDTARVETNNETAQRELMLHIWYPTDSKKSNPETLYDRDAIENAQEFIQNGVPSWLLVGLNSTRIFAVPHAKIAASKAPFPVIIASHGAGAMMQHYNWFCQELASQGYIVVGINHPYMATTRFPDGRLIKSLLNQKRKEGKYIYKTWKQEQFEVAVQDVKFIINYLEQLNLQPTFQFYNKLDLNNLGICGHSAAGSLAMRMCIEDKRIKAGVAFDSTTRGNDNLISFNTPFLEIVAAESHVWTGQEGKSDHEKLLKLCKMPGMHMTIATIENIGHGVFSDLPLFLHQTLLTQFLSYYIHVDVGGSSMRSRKIQAAVNTYMIDFFNTYLKNSNSKLLKDSQCDLVIDID